MTMQRADAAFNARSALRGLAGFAAAGVGLTALGWAGFGIPCPWRSLTGTLCPLCGATHVASALLRLDLAGAVAANAFLVALGGVLAVLGLLWAVEAVGGPAVRPPQRVTRSADRWWLALGVLGLTWAVLRNVW